MTDETATGERIAKVMARAGVASRRDAEKMIVAGRVAVNGAVVTSPALDVRPGDKVTLDGKPIDAPQPARLWLYYKPVGLVTSARDEKGRQTVFDTMPEGMPRVMSIGRLDLNSEGLLLLTNDGELKRRLELPSTGWLRKYRVRVNGRPNEATFDPLRRGVAIDGEDLQPMEVTLDKQQGANAWLTVGIREGKNREVRRAMAEVGLTVNRLIRVSYGPFRLNTMKPGDVVEVKARVLRDQLGAGGEEKPPQRKPRAGAAKDPKRGGKPGVGDRVFKPRPLREDRPEGHGGNRSRRPGADTGDRPPRSGAPRKPRPLMGEETGERPFRARAPRAEGDEKRPPRKAAGDRPYKPRPPREGDESRPPRKAAGDRPHKPRPPREGDEARPPRKAAGDRPHKPRPPREGDEARPPRKAAGDRPHKPRPPREGDEARPPRKSFAKAADGDRAFRSRPPRPDRGEAATGGPDRREGGNREGGKREGGKPFKPRGAAGGPARPPRAEAPRGPRGGDDRRGGKPGPAPGRKPGGKPGPKPGPKPRGRG
ncbi:pseudouridine synthase [Albidovulum sp.]|uniref:pseudouridine synthase n=1 Tax=Albidovulum sp. TaxID=1872424 RepID=UPI00265ACEC6|nr:pseudouridine synthase [uncultured Defluviimonas sp.]